MQNLYGIKIRMGGIIAITEEQKNAITQMINSGIQMLEIGDSLINAKDISVISTLSSLDTEDLAQKRAYRCRHGNIYMRGERCTCSMYGGAGFIAGNKELSSINYKLIPPKDLNLLGDGRKYLKTLDKKNTKYYN